MATRFRDINWFRFGILVMFSLLTELIAVLHQSFAEPKDYFLAIMGCLLVGIAYLQCPSNPPKVN